MSILYMRYPIVITKSAWQKMIQVLQDTNRYAFLFSAKGGGCNGFNYHLQAQHEHEITEMISKSKIMPTTYTQKDYSLFVDPMCEMILLGTTIDYINEDMDKHIYESKFTFTPRKELASSCGCGVSFAPRHMEED